MPTHAYTSTYLGRLPIFDASTHLWGYELLFRHAADAQRAVFSDSDAATLQVAAMASVLPRGRGEQPMPIMLNFTGRSVVDRVPLALPAERCVIKIREAEALYKDVLTALKEMREAGYRIALDHYSNLEGAEPLYSLCDMFIVDMLGASEMRIESVIQKARFYGQSLLAKRVETHELFAMAQRQGFTYYAGFFFTRPEVVAGRTLSSVELSRLRLFRHLQSSEPDFEGLAEIIRSDVSISYRLLSHLNSAAFDFPEKIRSIQQAVLLLGWQTVRNWLRVILVSDLLPPGKTRELTVLSAVRARFLEQTALGHGQSEEEACSLFLLGLLSLLEPMLDMPMAEIVTSLPLDETLAAALCGQDSPYTPWIELAQGFESGDWHRLDELTDQLDLQTDKVAGCYFDSLVWANSFFAG